MSVIDRLIACVQYDDDRLTYYSIKLPETLSANYSKTELITTLITNIKNNTEHIKTIVVYPAGKSICTINF